MTPNELWLLAGMTAVTVLSRYPVLALSGGLVLPPWLVRALAYVPPAVLTAIVVPAVLVDGDALWVSWANPRLVGALIALGVGLWRRQLLLTIALGMGGFWLWQGLVS